MIIFPEHLEQPFKQLAEQQHETADALLAQLVEDYLEDYHDVQLAQAAIERLERGESELISLEDAERMLNELDN